MKEEYKASAQEAEQSRWKSTSNNKELPVSVPKSFGGEGKGLTPEHLYAASLLNCYLATLRVIAQKSNVDIESLGADITATLDTEENPPLKSAQINVSGQPDSKKMRMVAEKARQHCYIHQSVQTEITVMLNDDEI